MEYTVTMNDKQIYTFYKDNPHLKPETLHKIMLSFIENITDDMTKFMQSSFQTQVMNELKEIKLGFNHLNDSLLLKMNDHNKSFIETLKLIINDYSHNNNDKTSSILQTHIESYTEKINRILPSLNEENYKKMQEHLGLIQKSILLDIKELLSSKNEIGIQDFISSFDSKLHTLQQPLYTIIHSNQEQLNNKITSLNTEFNQQNNSTSKIYSEMSEYLNRYKISSQFKGQCAETELEQILSTIWPNDKFERTTGIKESGDFILFKDEKEYIMLETKSYTANVDKREVEKFIRDAKIKNLHSIMMSHTSGIVGKQDFTIDITDTGCILIYLLNVNFSSDKIKLAIEIINKLSPKINQIMNETKKEDTSLSITKESIDRLYNDYNDFNNKKNKLKQMINDFNKSMNNELDNMKLPELTFLLNGIYKIENTLEFVCPICGNSYSSSIKLANHKRSHLKKNISLETEESISNETENVVVSTSTEPETKPKQRKKNTSQKV